MTTKSFSLGYLKKRIFAALEESAQDEDGVFFTDSRKSVLAENMCSAVNGAFARMFESLPIGKEKAEVALISPVLIGYSARLMGAAGDKVTFAPFSEGVAVHFEYYGNGQVLFCDGEGNVLYRHDAENTKGRVVEQRLILDSCEKRMCCLVVSGNLCLKNVCVYDAQTLSSEKAIPPYGYSGFVLPDDFDTLTELFADKLSLPQQNVVICDGCGFVPNKLLNYCCETVTVCYKKAPPYITDETEDSFCFDLQPIIFEALVNLCASQLCTSDNNGMYSRLVYKYTDLAESCFSINDRACLNRNSFFAEKERRW